MKIKNALLSVFLFAIGVFTLYYFFLSLKNNYNWTISCQGFGGIILFPITILIGLICIIYSFVPKKGKDETIVAVAAIILAIVWLIFLQNISLQMQDDQTGKPRGVLLDRKTRLGEMLPDTKWAELKQRIFYISTDEKFYKGALCSINCDGSERKKIFDDCERFGWMPNSEDMFVISGKNILYRLKKSGEIKEEIYKFSRYYWERGNIKNYVFPQGGMEWSPQGDRFIFSDRDKDTNGDRLIDWHDDPGLFIFDIATKTKNKIEYGETGKYASKYLWGSSGDRIYSISQNLAPDHMTYDVYEFNLRTNAWQKVKKFVTTINKSSEDCANEEKLFFIPKQGSGIRFEEEGFSTGKEIEPRNNIKLSIGGYKASLFIQKNGQLPKKIFEYIGTTTFENSPRGGIFDFLWLPGDRYVIFCSKTSICILDTKTERIGILTKGSNPAWHGMGSD